MYVCVDAETYRSLNIPESQKIFREDERQEEIEKQRGAGANEE